MKSQQQNSQNYVKYLEKILIQSEIKFKSFDQFTNQLHKQQKLAQCCQNETKLQSNMSSQLNGKLVQRYCRQMLLKEIAYQGQSKIINTKIAIIGSGGIGCPVAMYLATAGVGTLGLFDSDVVDVTNLHRQIGHQTQSVGRHKTQSLKQTLLGLNPHIRINQHPFISIQSCSSLSQYDLIIDGSDNPQCRYIVNDYCMSIQKKLLSGACIGWQGQITCYGGENAPCYRCVWGNEQKTTGGCSTLGVVGMLPGFVGIILGVEALKLILNGYSSLQSNLITYEAKSANFRKMKLRQKNKDCIACGQKKFDMNLYDYSIHAICKPDLSNLPVVPQISWQQFLKQPHLIVDVRPQNHHKISHLKCMISLPYQRLSKLSLNQINEFLNKQQYFNKDNKNKQIFVSCNRGVMSRKAADLLIKNGLNAVSIKGGITQYSKSIDSTVPQI